MLRKITALEKETSYTCLQRQWCPKLIIYTIQTCENYRSITVMKRGNKWVLTTEATVYTYATHRGRIAAAVGGHDISLRSLPPFSWLANWSDKIKGWRLLVPFQYMYLRINATWIKLRIHNIPHTPDTYFLHNIPNSVFMKNSNPEKFVLNFLWHLHVSHNIHMKCLMLLCKFIWAQYKKNLARTTTNC